MIGHGAVERTDPFDRRIEMIEEFVSNPCCDLGPKAARELIFVGHDDPTGPAHGLGDGRPVVRGEGSEINDTGTDVLLRGAFCGEDRALSQSPPRDYRDV